MTARPVSIVALGLAVLAGCSDVGSGSGARSYTSADLQRLLVSRTQAGVPASWTVSTQSEKDGSSAERLFSNGGSVTESITVVLSSTSTPDSASGMQSLNVRVDQRLLRHARVTRVRLRTRSGIVEAGQVTGYDATTKHDSTHLQYAAGTIVGSVLGSDAATVVRVARAQAARLPAAH